jgi:transcriptional regulator
MAQYPYARGNGALSVEQQGRVLEMLESGISQKAVADAFGVTKNTVAGIWHRHGSPGIDPKRPQPTTLFQRCDALEARMRAVLDATEGVGRITEGAARPPAR